MIVHPIPPLFDENSKTLILGSFPSVKSREAEFFYGHPQNRYWAVIAKIFECEKPSTIEEKKKLVLSNKLQTVEKAWQRLCFFCVLWYNVYG